MIGGVTSVVGGTTSTITNTITTVVGGTTTVINGKTTVIGGTPSTRFDVTTTVIGGQTTVVGGITTSAPGTGPITTVIDGTTTVIGGSGPITTVINGTTTVIGATTTSSGGSPVNTGVPTTANGRCTGPDCHDGKCTGKQNLRKSLTPFTMPIFHVVALLSSPTTTHIPVSYTHLWLLYDTLVSANLRHHSSEIYLLTTSRTSLRKLWLFW